MVVLDDDNDYDNDSDNDNDNDNDNDIDSTLNLFAARDDQRRAPWMPT